MKTLNPSFADHPFVKDLPPEHLEILACDAREIDFPAGQTIFREGEIASRFYLIQHGQVALESRTRGRDGLPIQTLGEGEVLGWSWLFPPFTWHFQARAVDPGRGFVLDGARLLVRCEADHKFGYELMKRIAQVLIQRLQATRAQLFKAGLASGPAGGTGETSSTHFPKFTGAAPLETAIAAHPFLKGLPPTLLKILAEAAMPVQFDAGQLIFHEGDVANRFYLLQQGRVELTSHQADQDAVSIQTLGEGEALGWSWLFPPYYWHFDARAVEPTRAIFFYGTRLREQCEQDPELGFALMRRMTRVLISRLQATRDQLIAAGRK